MALLYFLLSLVGGTAVVPLLGLLGTMAAFLPSESRALCDIDRAINSPATLGSRPPGCNQLTLRVLSVQSQPLGQCLCRVLLSPAARPLSPMPTPGASTALQVEPCQQL